jgi:hypothetical protein
VEPPEADEGVDTRLKLVHRRGKPFLRVIALAGMVARPRQSRRPERATSLPPARRRVPRRR